MSRRPSSYEELYQGFRWAIPPRFNMARAVCERHALQDPDRLALVYVASGKEHRYSFGQIWNLSGQLANVLRHHGVERGDRVAILLGGRIAEEITLGNLTTGAGNDLERATELARKMVCEWGMSEAMGPLTFGKKEEQIFLGREIAQHQDYSEDTAIRIDQEIKHIVMENYERSRAVLVGNREKLVMIADALLVREVLDGEQVMRIAKGLPADETAPQAAATEDAAPAGSKDRPAIMPSIPKPVPQE